MTEISVFVSVGATATPEQEAFVAAVEDRLRAEGLAPHTVGRNSFSADAPLKTTTTLLDQCAGTVVIALERLFFASGAEKRGGEKETALSQVKLPTCWNQIEAAMAYSRGHPLLMIVENGIRNEGLLERGYDWYVQYVNPDKTALHSAEFNGVLASWKQKIIQSPAKRVPPKASDMTVAELLGGLKLSQLWAVIAALATLLAGAFVLGGKYMRP
jgi:hypothetical protein